MSNNKKTVVIIGGGYGGITAAKALDSKFNVILIDRKKAFFHNIGAPRLLVDPSFAKKLYLPWDNLLKNGKVVYGLAREITNVKVVLESNEEFTFDYLIIATGSNNPAPFKSILDVDNAQNYVSNLNNQLKSSKKVLIVGGGAVGLEIAGEIAQNYKDKEITLVHRGSKLVNDKMNDKFYSGLNKKIESTNIKVILNDSIAVPEDVSQSINNMTGIIYNNNTSTYTTQSGQNIQADIVFWTIGNKINNESFSNHFAGVMEANGQIKVNSHLQVEGYSNIFAVGDITNIKELKTSYHAAAHSGVVAKNIQALSNAKDPNNVKLNEHKSLNPTLVVTFGSDSGMSQIPNGWVLGGFLSSKIKSKHFFAPRFKKEMGSPKEFQFNLTN